MESSGYVCYECGVKYLTEAQKKEDRVSTYHHGTCCLCREIKGVTHIRNFNYLHEWERKPTHQLRCGWDESDSIQS